MARNKQNIIPDEQKLAQEIFKDTPEVNKLKEPQLDSSSPKNRTKIEDILEERSRSRDIWSIYVQGLANKSFWLLATVVVAQSAVRIFSNPTLELVSPVVINVLAVSVFGQVVSVILVIVKSLWDDTNYINKLG